MKSAVIALIIANMLWGAAAPIFKFSFQNVPPMFLAFIRFFLSAIVLIPFVSKQSWKVLSKEDWKVLILSSILGFSLHIGFFFLGLERTRSINIGIIASAGPVFIYFASVRYLKEKAHPRIFFGMMISLLGALIVILSPTLTGGGGTQVKSELMGNVFYVLSTLGSVVSIILLKPLFKKVSIAQVTFVNYAIAALTFFPFAVHAMSSWSVAQLDYRGIIGIVYATIFSTLIASYLNYYGIARILTEEVGVFSYIDPIVTILIAAPLLHEYPDWYFSIGAILVFLGILIAEKRLQWHPLHRLFMRKQ